MEKDPLSLETRRRIFQFISDRPGTYIREIERELAMQFGLIQYHLGILEDMKLLTSVDDGFRKRYYVSHEVGKVDREMLSVLKLKTPRRIAIYLIQNGNSTFDGILSQFEFTKSALSFHMKKLLMSGSSFSYESSFSVPSIAVTSVSAARNNIHVAVGSSGVNSPATMVFLFDGAIYNLTASQAYVYVNGARISHQAGLTSILMNGPGNLTSYNVTHIGSFTLVAISSPSQISDIRLSTASSPGFLSSVSGAASGLIPLVAALSVISIASVALYRRKSREES